MIAVEGSSWTLGRFLDPVAGALDARGMPTRARLVSLPALAAALAAGGCADVLPGDPVGTFTVEGRLVEDGCDGAVPALESADYGVELRRDESTAWWRADGKPLLAGRYLGEGRFRFTFRSTFPVEDPAGGGAACRVAQEELVDARTPPEDPDVDADLVGAQEITYRPVSGDCAFLLDQGFDALPCTLRWDLLGWRAD